MRFISWNVNGLRAAVGKGFFGIFQRKLMRIYFPCRKQSYRQGRLI